MEFSTKIIPWIEEKDRGAGCTNAKYDPHNIGLERKKKFEWKGFVVCKHDKKGWKEVTGYVWTQTIQDGYLRCVNHTSSGCQFGDWMAIGEQREIEIKREEEVFEECRHE